MVNSNTSFGKLKEVIVGDELQLPKRSIDLTFKYFYKEALGQGLYNSAISEYKINEEILQKRIEQLDGLAKTLESLGIEVYRPEPLKQIKQIQTPFFKSEASPASNVRDLTLVYKDKIIETPCFIRNRYFENMLLSKIFKEKSKGSQWIKAPLTTLSEMAMDLEDWREDRDFQHVDARYEMAIDAAQFLRIGRDVIVNVSTFNHWLGLEWVKSFYPESDFHAVKWCDNHIDGAIASLRPSVFLLSPTVTNEQFKQLPSQIQKCKFIVPDDSNKSFDAKGLTDVEIQLASSRGMDLNVLSIDEQTVLVNKRAVNVIRALEKEHFIVVPIELDNGELFGGGIHCSTLDLVREDEYARYI